ncbi:MAG: hypothetical protein J6T23_03235 [Elusimicrobia bacterium]|nr:hypothetical protein [Elusimicrobiota bacterium]
MDKFIMFIGVIFALTFVSCENKQQNIEVQNTDSVVISSATESVSSIQEEEKETNYFPAIERYLITECGSKYLVGQYCVPFQTVIGVDERNPDDILVWGDFWVFNYNLVGDTLETVSGGSHPGLMHIKQTDTGYEVTAFDQVEDGSGNLPSAKKIFGEKYNAFHAVNSNAERREKHRAEVLATYVKKNNIPVTKYKDYGWPAKYLIEE